MEEKKVYSVTGTVTIGTDEYRDLLTDKFEAEKKARDESDRWYKEYSRANELQKQVDSLKAELDKYKKFIKKNSVNISEEGVAVFMSMLGEE